MPTKSTPKSTAATKRAPTKRKIAPKSLPFEIWRCKVEWVRHHGRVFEKGDILEIPRVILQNESEMAIIRKYFTPTKTESVVVESEPVEILDEGE